MRLGRIDALLAASMRCSAAQGAADAMDGAASSAAFV
jgi:hypothetical protein